MNVKDVDENKETAEVDGNTHHPGSKIANYFHSGDDTIRIKHWLYRYGVPPLPRLVAQY